MSFPIHRPRRLRKVPGWRETVRETVLHREHLMYPLFVSAAAREPEAISSMPGQFRWPVSRLVEPVGEALGAGVRSFLLFGLPADKDPDGNPALDPDGIVPQAVRTIKTAFPDALVATDVCLCAYTRHGHCGLLDGEGYLRNDATLPRLAAMALAHARAGADLISPSDMMDGRIGAIRTALDEAGYAEVPIMSYAAKFASAFYGPFREAAGSAPQHGDRQGYQMDAGNQREALWEMDLDFQEGADILMVKPGIAYLDILALARPRFPVPLAVYQVSGEFAMIKAGAERGWIDERKVVLESLLAMRRAGADLILTYFAPDVARWLAP